MSMPVSKKSNGEDVQNSRRSRSAARGPASEKRARSKADPAVPAARRKVKQEAVAPIAEHQGRAGAMAPATGDLSSGALAPANEITGSPTNPVLDAFAISPEERSRLIAEAAYFRAQRRGFDGGEEQALQDWIEAEAEIDRALNGANRDQKRD